MTSKEYQQDEYLRYLASTLSSGNFSEEGLKELRGAMAAPLTLEAGDGVITIRVPEGMTLNIVGDVRINGAAAGGSET